METVLGDADIVVVIGLLDTVGCGIRRGEGHRTGRQQQGNLRGPCAADAPEYIYADD